MTRSARIVELVGPPGAGKTTLLPAVQTFFREQGQTAYTVVEAARPFASRTIAGRLVQRLSPAALRGPLLWRLFLLLSFVYRTRFIAKHPRLVWKVIQWQRRRPAGADAGQRKVLFWLFRLMGYYEFLKAHLRADELLLLDEGFLHRVVQLFSSTVEEPVGEYITHYTNLIPSPDLVIFVSASPQTCQKRIYVRGLWDAFRHKDATQVICFVHNAHRAVLLAVDSARRTGWTVVEVDNDQNDPVAAQAELQQQLVNILATRKSSAVAMEFA